MKKFWFLLPFVMLVASCSKHYVAVRYQPTKQPIEAALGKDEKIQSIIAPYKDSLERTMNGVLVVNEAMLSKGQPESDLGNLLTDVLLSEANKSCGDKKAVVAIINNGGIRVPQLGAGEVTLGKVFEIMPFENKLVLMDLSGTDLKALFDAIATAGGWPLSGAKFVIKDKKATDITVAGLPLDESKTYTIALSDYLTEGGDNLYMLKGKPVIACNQTLRDAFVAGFKQINAEGRKLKSSIEGRIKE